MQTTKPIQSIVDEWLDTIDVADISKVSYRAKVMLWYRWLSRMGYDVRRPERAHVIAWRRDLEASNRSTLTIDGYISAVRIFYRWCVGRHYCVADITEGVRTATKIKGHRKSPLPRDVAARLLDSINTDTLTGKRDKLMIALMMLLGLRTCEVERIDVADLSVVHDTHVIHVRRKGRHDKSESLALTPYLDALLTDYMSEREVQSLGEPLFMSVRRRHGTRLRSTSISEIVHTRLAAIGIRDPRLTAHSLRHTCACLMLAEGVDMETVRDMLGHTSTNTTRLYTAQMQAELLIRDTPAKRVERALNLSLSP